MRTLTVFAALVLAALAQAEEWSKRFDVSGMPALHIEADDATVILRPGPASAVAAHVSTQGWPIGPDGVRVTARQNGNRIDIEVRVPNASWNLGNRSVRLEVAVPPELRAEVRTGDGRVSAEGLKGEMRFTTGDGSIDANGLDGSLTARSGDGEVKARGRFDQLDVRTNDGSIQVTANAGSKPASSWRLQTGDGSVTLRMPETFAADLDVKTGDGDIAVHLPVTSTGFRSDEHALRGRLNGGGPVLRIRTGDGSIRVEKL